MSAEDIKSPLESQDSDQSTYSDVNEQDDDGKSALHWACEQGDEKIVEELVLNGADVNVVSGSGVTPLMSSVANNRFNVARILVEHGADVNSRNAYGANALMMATARGNVRMAKLLVEYGSDSGNVGDSLTPLMVAAQYAHPKLIAYLCHATKAHCQIDNETDKGVTALMMATSTGHKPTVKALLDRGACTELTNCQGKNIYDLAASTDHNLAAYIRRKISNMQNSAANQSEIMQAVIQGDYNHVRKCLKTDWTLSSMSDDDEGTTPLMMACMSGDVNMVHILSYYGADADMKDKYGWTALMWAAIYQHEECCRILLNNCDTNAKNNDGLTAADMVFFSGDGDSSLEHMFADYLYMNLPEHPLSISGESSGARPKLPNIFRWWRNRKKKPEKTINDNKNGFQLNNSPIYLHEMKNIPTMDSVNMKLRGNDIRPLDPLKKTIMMKKERPIPAMAEKETDFSSDTDSSTSSVDKLSISFEDILEKYDIQLEDDVDVILGKAGLEQYIPIFSSELVVKKDLKQLDIDDLHALGMKDETHIQTLLSITRSLPQHKEAS